MEKVTFTLKDINSWIYAFQRRAQIVTNPQAIKLSQNVASALEEFYNWNIQHGCPINNEFVATDSYII